MSYNCGFRNSSSISLGGYQRQPVSTYNPFYSSNVTYSPTSCQLGSSLYDGQQETFHEPVSWQVPRVGATSFQTSSYCPKNFILSSPCPANYTGSFGYSNSGLGSFGPGNTGFQSLASGSSFCRPTYSSSGSCQSSFYQPSFGSCFFGSTY